jgi:hypothetical protein
MNSGLQLTFALAQAEFWRLKYLKAVEEEREACAKVCEQKSAVKGGEIFAARIRARGEHEAAR